ncbi:hypothetical protein FCV25MIE_34734 [Fagus crenata]
MSICVAHPVFTLKALPTLHAHPSFPKAMNSSALPWCFMLFFLSITFTFNSFSSSATPDTYHDLCSSTVPGSSSKEVPLSKFPLPRTHKGYYTGGDNLLIQNSYSYCSSFSNSIFLRTKAVYGTDVIGLFKVELGLTFQVGETYREQRPRRSSITFELNGFYSETSGKLCVFGPASTYSKDGGLLKLVGVLKLYNLTKSTNVTSLISGTLQSLSSDNEEAHFDTISMLFLPQMNYTYTYVSEDYKDGFYGIDDPVPQSLSLSSDNEEAHFDTISMLFLPQMNYTYTYVSEDSKDGFYGIDDPVPQSLSLSSLPTQTFCSIVSRAVNQFNLKYSKGCNIFEKNCNPLDKGLGYVPSIMSLSEIDCSEKEERMRVLVEFPNGSCVNYYRSFNPNMTLIGEGSWDESRNQLLIVACRFLGVTQSFADAHLGDCSMKLSLRFPKVWSIKGASSIVGQVWSNKTQNELGYFDKIMFQSARARMGGIYDVSSLKYEYTKIDLASKSCPKPDKSKTKGKLFPTGFSYDMRVHMSVKKSKEVVGWGYFVPISVGDEFYQLSNSIGSEEPSNFNTSGPVSISYNIDLTLYMGGLHSSNTSSRSYDRFEALAEGLYDAETGSLCMIGCRNIGSMNDSLDCEILVKLQFPPINKRNADRIKGSIKSTRDLSDPLYFELIDLSAYAYYSDEASIWRMDAEIIMVLISTTLSCVFVGLQLFHVKRHPDVLPLTSLVMLSILTLGHMIPLVLNFEALFFKHSSTRSILYRSGGWIEANEVIVRVVGMVAFLFQFRLLLITWSARRGNGNQKGTWVAEKKVLFVVLPLYAAGAFVAVMANWGDNNESNAVRVSSSFTSSHTYKSHSLWVDLKSYAGLVLDGFLLPQILLNMLWNSRERTLSFGFYIGNTFVRLLPHAYDLYRAHNNFHHYDGSCICANPGADFYSTAWDVVISLGGLLFALIIYLQQKFGGRFIFPRRFRELEVYEKVPVVSDA